MIANLLGISRRSPLHSKIVILDIENDDNDDGYVYAADEDNDDINNNNSNNENNSCYTKSSSDIDYRTDNSRWANDINDNFSINSCNSSLILSETDESDLEFLNPKNDHNKDFLSDCIVSRKDYEKKDSYQQFNSNIQENIINYKIKQDVFNKIMNNVNVRD